MSDNSEQNKTKTSIISIYTDEYIQEMIKAFNSPDFDKALAETLSTLANTKGTQNEKELSHDA